MKRALFLAAIVAAAGAMPGRSAHASITGNKLLSMCNEFPLECLGFVVGVADTMDAAQTTLGSLGGLRACIPADATHGQVLDVTLRYLNEHPNTRHWGAAGLVAHALAEGFPCH